MNAPSTDDSIAAAPRSAFAFLHPLRVRWSEVDPQGIVFNPNYLVYFDVAATEYWRALGYAYPEGFTRDGVDTFAKVARAEFHASAKFDDALDIGVRTARLGRTSLRLLFGVFRGEDLLVDGEIVYVTADPAAQRPVPIPDRLRTAILAHERVRPEGA